MTVQRYIKIFVRFPKGMKAFWDDTHYIFYVDPNVRSITFSLIFLNLNRILKFVITFEIKGEVAIVAES